MSSRRVGAAINYDLSMSDTDDPAFLGESIAYFVSLQGFAVIRSGVSGAVLQRARSEASAFAAAGHLEAVPNLIADGLLGEEGSVRIASLTPSSPSSGNAEACMEVDGVLGYAADAIADSMQWLVGEGSSLRKTEAIVHEAGVQRGEPPELTQKVAIRWMETFQWQRLLLVVFLGPGRGVLELKPFDEDGALLRLPTEAGMMVALRSDQMWHRHGAPMGNFALSCFLTQSGLDAVNVDHVPQKVLPAQRLDDWLMTYLDDAAQDNLETIEEDIRMKYMVDHLYHTGQKFAVRGVAWRGACTYDPESLYLSMLPGSDIATEIPVLRWDHNMYYADDEDAWKMFKVNVKHATFMEGCDMFDAKFFRISPAETKGMDPLQRQILEIGYSALANAGRTQKSLLQSLTGVYVGCHLTEFTIIDTGPVEAGGCEQRSAGTGFAGSIMANRFSFIFGMMGPSIQFDVDASASLVALEAGCVALNENKQNATMSSCTGVTVILTPLTWFHRVGLGQMTSKGRCLSFDQSAAGWIKSESGGSLAVDNLLETVDGVPVQDNSRDCFATVADTTIKHMGVTATLGTPHAASIQALIADACRHGNVSPLSVDVIECQGDGQQLNEIVEVAASAKLLCSEERPLPGFSSLKSGYGNSIHSGGMTQLIKTFFAQAYGSQAPAVHLYRMNPHISMALEEQEGGSYFNTEALLYPLKTSVVGVTAIGWGGTLAHSVCCNGVDAGRRNEPRESPPLEPLTFWPGGGGTLTQQPKSYHIIGSWSGWSQPTVMENEGNGVFAFTVVLGANRFEDFQIWCDGSPAQILHPGEASATSGCKVHGPDEVAAGCSWRIDGRVFLYSTAQAQGEVAALEGSAEPEQAKEAEALVPVAAKTEMYESTVAVGDRYRVKLTVAGKWRCVAWSRLPGHAETLALALSHDPSIAGTYHIATSFNAWLFQVMSRVETTPGLYKAEIRLLTPGASFQIARNADWSQVFYPDEWQGGEVSGPASVGHGASWWIDGKAGDIVEVEFQRSLEDGRDRRRISWRTVRHEPLTNEEAIGVSRGRYCIVGSWDSWNRAHEMVWDGSSFRYNLQVGSTGVERFQVLAGGAWDQRLFPSIADANPYDDHELCMGSPDYALDWAVGLHEAEQNSAGESFTISLVLSAPPSRTPKSVTWHRGTSAQQIVVSGGVVGDVELQE